MAGMRGALYARAARRRCAAFGGLPSIDPNSVFMEKYCAAKVAARHRRAGRLRGGHSLARAWLADSHRDAGARLRGDGRARQARPGRAKWTARCWSGRSHLPVQSHGGDQVPVVVSGRSAGRHAGAAARRNTPGKRRMRFRADHRAAEPACCGTRLADGADYRQRTTERGTMNKRSCARDRSGLRSCWAAAPQSRPRVPAIAPASKASSSATSMRWP